MNFYTQRAQLKQKRKNLNTFKIFFTATLGIIVILFVLSSPLFNISSVEIIGNNVVTIDEIKKYSEFTEGKNIFMASSSKAFKNLKLNPYIKKVEIQKHYPDKVTITIVERKARAYVEYKNMNSYLLIDEKGMVLGVETFIKEKLPVIVGLNFSDYIKGQPLKTKNEKSFQNVVLLSQLFEKYEMDDVIKVEVTDEMDVHLYIGNINVYFGSIVYADEKVRTIKACIEGLQATYGDVKGFLYAQDIDTDPIFEYLK